MPRPRRVSARAVSAPGRGELSAGGPATRGRRGRRRQPEPSVTSSQRCTVARMPDSASLVHCDGALRDGDPAAPTDSRAPDATDTVADERLDRRAAAMNALWFRSMGPCHPRWCVRRRVRLDRPDDGRSDFVLLTFFDEQPVDAAPWWSTSSARYSRADRDDPQRQHGRAQLLSAGGRRVRRSRSQPRWWWVAGRAPTPALSRCGPARSED